MMQETKIKKLLHPNEKPVKVRKYELFRMIPVELKHTEP